MRRVTRIETSDGVLHLDRKAAGRHAEKRYGDALLSIARELAPLSYSPTAEWIDANLNRFLALHELHDDLMLDDPEEGEDDAV